MDWEHFEGKPHLTVRVIRQIDRILRVYSAIAAFQSWQADQIDDDRVIAAYAALLARRLQ